MGEDTSLRYQFVSEFRHLAAFSNAGGSKSIDVESEAKFCTFCPFPVKIRGTVGEISGSINEGEDLWPNLRNTFDGRRLRGCWEDQIWGPISEHWHFMGGLTLPRWNPIWPPAAILKNGHDVITPPRVVRFWRNSAGWCRMTRRWRKLGQNRNRK